ncbi:kinase-like domain-containing protein [Choanephora cucurbitarum]|nr:kinase-like domain-containing protein [Choanephora cucurbitarum]
MLSPLTIGTRIDDLEITQVLNMGAFGQVYLARQPYTLERYAIKSLPHTGLDHRQLAFQKNEIALHSYLSDHPHIIRLEKVVQTAEYTHAILEYGSEGDLFSAITEKGLYYGNHDLIRSVFLQLIDAVRYSHAHHIYHRDLKPENVLVFEGGRTVKLADFGLATTEAVSTDFGCGSTFYFSPECQGGLDQSRKIGYATAPNDVWALGIILINLAAGRNPWRLASLEDETFSGFLQDPNLLLKILPISIELNRILKRIFCLDPHRRITLDELHARISRCAHFTRTPEVVRYETMVLLNKKKGMKIQLPSSQLDLPSPPNTPGADTRSLCSTPSTQSALTEPDLYDNQKKGNVDSQLRIVV